MEGAVILSAAERIGPEAQEGRWIADIMEETNFRLVFGLLKDRSAAIKHVGQRLVQVND